MPSNPQSTKTDLESLRRRILEQATHLFVASGYSAISMREIAAAAGLSKAGLYYHFKNKEDLFIAILMENLEIIGQIVIKASQSTTKTYSRLLNITEWIFEQPSQQRSVIRLASQEMANVSPSVRSTFNLLYYDKFINPIINILEEGVARGELRDNPTELTCWIFLGMMYPFLNPETNRKEIPPALLAEQIMNIFIKGVGINSQSK